MVDIWANFATYGKPIPSPDEMLDGGKKKLESLVWLNQSNIIAQLINMFVGKMSAIVKLSNFI